jgi:homoserine kinase
MNDFWEPTPILESKLVTSLSIPVSEKLKVISIIPDYELSTSLARSVLPDKYFRQDIVYNLQRISVLSLALKGDQDGNLDPSIISECLKDKIHQP